MSGAVGMLTMRRLQAPARHKPGVEQHQRRALWLPPREATSNIQNRAAGKPICGRFGAYQTFDWDRHRRPNMIARVTSSRFDYVRVQGATDGANVPMNLPTSNHRVSRPGSE